MLLRKLARLPCVQKQRANDLASEFEGQTDQ